MKIKYNKFSFEMSPKDIEWIMKLSTNDQLKFLGVIIGSACMINACALHWYKVIKEENRKDEELELKKIALELNDIEEE